MAVGYCPHCKQNVLLKRDDIDICLAIILLIFTAGIGLIVYLIIYYSKPENKCIHCGSVCQVMLPSQYPEPSTELSYKPQTNSKQISYRGQALPQLKEDLAFSEKIEEKTCPFCGEKLDNRGVKHCPNCGSKL